MAKQPAKPEYQFTTEHESRTKSFAEYEKSLFSAKGVVLELTDQFTKYIKQNELSVKQVDKMLKRGRIMMDAFQDYIESIEDATDLEAKKKKQLIETLKLQKDVQKMTDKFVDGLNSAVQSLTKKLPLVGDKIAEIFDKKISQNIVKKLDKTFMKMFTQKGGGSMSLLSMGVFGAIAAGAGMIMKYMVQSEKAVTDLVKKTGFMRKTIQPIADSMLSAANNLTRFNISTEETMEMTSALLDEFGNLSTISQGMIETATKWSKAFGMGAQEVASTIDVLNRTVGLSNEGIEDFVNTLGTKAMNAGVSMNLVMRDVARDANFLAIYTKDSGRNIQDAAIQARKMGVALSGLQGMSDTFMDWESAVQNTMELNMLMGTDLNALELHRLAATGELVELNNKIVGSLAKQNKWEKMAPIQRKKAAEALGVSAEEAGKMMRAFSNPKWAAAQAGHEKRMFDINTLLDDQMTWWEEIWATLKSKVLPILRSMGQWLNKKIEPIARKLAGLIDRWFPDKDSMAGLSAGFSNMMRSAKEYIVDGLTEGITKGIKLGLARAVIGAPMWMKVLLGADTLGNAWGAVAEEDYRKRLSNVANTKGYDPALAGTSRPDAKFAKGGLVTKPTRALIGEAGPELIIPLKGSSGPKMSGGTLQFAKGGAVVPLNQLKGQRNTDMSAYHMGMNASAGSQSEYRRRTEEFRAENSKYQSEQMQTERKYWQQQKQYNDRQESGWSRLLKGITTFNQVVGIDFKKMIKDQIPREWKNVADTMRIRFDTALQTMSQAYQGVLKSIPGQVAQASLQLYQAYQQGGARGVAGVAASNYGKQISNLGAAAGGKLLGGEGGAMVGRGVAGGAIAGLQTYAAGGSAADALSSGLITAGAVIPGPVGWGMMAAGGLIQVSKMFKDNKSAARRQQEVVQQIMDTEMRKGTIKGMKIGNKHYEDIGASTYQGKRWGKGAERWNNTVGLVASTFSLTPLEAEGLLDYIVNKRGDPAYFDQRLLHKIPPAENMMGMSEGFETYYKQRLVEQERAAAMTSGPTVVGASGINQVVDRPTNIRAGEHYQRELVQVTPLDKKSNLGGGGGDNAELVNEIRSLKAALMAVSARPIQIKIDGRKVAEVVSAHQEAMS